VPKDDNESERATGPAGKALGWLRALARAAQTKGTPGGRWLALVPFVVAVVLFLLVMPRSTEPRDIPLPLIDERALGETIRADRARSAAAQESRLPSDVLALGSAMRAFNLAQVTSPGSHEVVVARSVIDDALRVLAGRQGAEADLQTLRAVQLEAFLVEVAKFEATGEESKELDELAGAFVRHMRDAGWIDGHKVLLDDAQRRVSYKIVWNTVAGTTRFASFQATIDEQRALYMLYLTRPHPPEPMRAEIDAERRAAKTADACARAEANESRATELWRAEKIKLLGAIDPSYPAGYALGVAYYRAGRYEWAIDAFRSYLDAHPDGTLAIRARNHLKAALDQYGAI